VVQWVLFKKYMSQRPGPLLRNLAIVMVFLSTVHDVVLVASSFHSCIKKPKGFQWPIPTGLLNNGLIAFCEHVYLIYRFYHLSKNLPLTTILLILTIAQAGCQLASAGIWLKNALSPLQLIGKTTNVKVTTAAVALRAAIDILVAIAVAWQLSRFSVAFATTKSLVRKIMVSTVISGALTALWGVLILALLVTDQYLFVTFSTTIGKIYVITVLANLTFLRGMRQESLVVLDFPSWMSSNMRAFFSTARSTTRNTSRSNRSK